MTAGARADPVTYENSDRRILLFVGHAAVLFQLNITIG